MSRKYLAFVPDLAGALSNRLKVRSTHLERLKQREVEHGVKVVSGGAFGPDFPKAEEGFPMQGSFLLFEAADKKAVQRFLETDIYSSNKVWDLANAKVYAYNEAVTNKQ